MNESPSGVKHLLWVTLFVALILAVADLLTIAINILLLVFAGIIFGIFLNALSRWFSRHTQLRYRWSFVIVVTLFVTLAGAGFYLVEARMSQQIAELSSQLRESGQQLLERLERQQEKIRYLPDLSELKDVVMNSAGVLSGLKTGVGWLLWGLTGALVIFFVGLYVAHDPELYEDGLVKLFPHSHRDSARQVLGKLRAALTRWMIGRLISMSVVGVSTAVAMWLLGVSLPITLGVVAALLTFIPNLGPILATVPQALLAFQVSPDTVLYVVLFNIGMQSVESYIVTPIVQRYEVTLPPAVTILTQLMMGVLVGAIGVILAEPVAVIVMLLVQTLYIRDRLGDPSPGRLAERN